MKILASLLASLSVVMATSCSAEPEPPIKEIVYRGGLIRFEIPQNWIEEYDTDAGGTFYEDGPDTGTLRLNVITAESPTDVGADDAAKLLQGLSGVDAGSIKRLPNGNAIGTQIERTTEQGIPITLFWWNLSNAVPPRHLRVASFSYTVLTAREHDDKTVSEVRMLGDAIERAEFSPILGEMQR